MDDDIDDAQDVHSDIDSQVSYLNLKKSLKINNKSSSDVPTSLVHPPPRVQI